MARPIEPRKSQPHPRAIRVPAFGVVLAIALALAGCAQYAEVRPKHPVLTGPPRSGSLAAAEKEIDGAL